MKKYTYDVYSKRKPLANKNGVVFPMQKLPYEKYAEVAKKRNEGKTPAELAEEYGVSVVSIRRAIRNFRIANAWSNQ